MYDAVMLSFGGFLGHCREGRMIGSDNDLDMIVRGDLVTMEQEKAFFRLLDARGVFSYRKKYEINPATGRYFWFSVRMYPEKECFKMCTWFNFIHKGYSWHCKGVLALVKGLPAQYLEVGPIVKFMDSYVHIPRWAGSCLDSWYRDWNTPRSGGNSSKYVLMRVKDWSNPDTWKIVKGLHAA